MPKRLKKNASGKLPVPAKPKRPADPNRAAKSILAEHMAKAAQGQPPWAKDFGEGGITLNFGPETEASFTAQLSAHMKAIGAKGGKVSGAKRMEMPEEQRKAIAKKAAEARWGKKN